jgi:heme-degrading monooxygenase HmoA
MVICIFGVTYRDDIDWQLNRRLNDAMARVVVTMPGFISLKYYKAQDGDSIGIIRFRTREDLKAWRDNVAHRGAWGEAPKLYREFWVQNCETFDDYVWIDGVHHDRDQTERFQMTQQQVLDTVTSRRG